MKTLFTWMLLLTALTGFSQEKFFAYREDWTNTADIKEAKFIMHVRKEDSLFVCRYYHLTGPMIKMESYRDEELSIPFGRFAWYNYKGKCDSTGHVVEGRKDKRWMYFTHPDSSDATIMERFDNGKFQSRTDYINKRTTYRDGRVVPFDTTTSDTITVQKEASFPNGLTGWRKYLQKNLKTPDRFVDLAKGSTKATVIVSFTVGKDGSISDAYIHKSVEWSVDLEALKAIKNGPKWEPAMQNGNKVLFFQRQPITFVVEEE